MQRNLPLDGIRGLAILGVMLHHFVVLPNNSFSHILLNLFFGAGWIGVDLFFVLSSFLITDILLRTRDQDHYFRNFYARRILRIFPLYYAFLLGFFIFVALKEDSAWSELGWHMFFASNFLIVLNNSFLPWLNHLWTLAVEEQFYLFWPFVVFAMNGRRLGAFCAVLIALVVASRFYILSLGQDSTFLLHVTTLFRMDTFAVGAGAACLVQTSKGRAWASRWAPSLFVVFLILTAWMAYRNGMLHFIDPWMQEWGYLLLASMFGALVLSGFTARKAGVLASVLSFAPLRFLGVLSFGIYIFHYPLKLYMEIVWPTGVTLEYTGSELLEAALHTLVNSTLSVALAWISWQVLEKRMLKLKSKF